MEKIPTAEEILCEIADFSLEHCKMEQTIDYQIVQKLKQFAKLHVELALKSAAQKAMMEIHVKMAETKGTEIVSEDYMCSFTTCKTYSIHKESILEAYPLENIK